ncbi:hypothetical protein [uncultured Clostridium sp.]|uniref:alginate O-acetyltransferase AlgX-related protein n=1 Tax=uncultured Clostridium sp. TaxID=59620 RepID=UPI0025D7492E|nr:hypothetical protein [uncultured Clostridium sp.]
MNRLLIKKFITSIIFVIILIFFCIQNIITSWIPLKNEALEVRKRKETTIEANIYDEIGVNNPNKVSDIGSDNLIANLDYIQDRIKSIETTINENTYKKYRFIESYGFLQKLMGKKEEGGFEVIKDKDNILHYTYFASEPKETEKFAVKTKDFKDGIINNKVKLIYLMTPDKYIRGKTKFERGIPYNYANETADNYLYDLKEREIDYIDLRENILERGLNPNDLFYKTDHHWNIETAFDQFTEFIEILNSRYDMNIDESGFYRETDNYNFIKYKNSYLGSMGRKCGKYYNGVDDFTLIYPKFETSYSFYARTKDYEINTEGRFEEALLSQYSINNYKNEYALSANKYDTYLFGNQGEVHITNNNNKNGIKVLFIKDSFVLPFAAFFSNVCSDTYLIDPRYYDKNILDFVNSKDIDLIIISFTPQDISDEFFNF